MVTLMSVVSNPKQMKALFQGLTLVKRSSIFEDSELFLGWVFIWYFIQYVDFDKEISLGRILF